MSNIKSDVVAFHENFPNKIKFISGKWFDENDNEIQNIDRYLFNLSVDKDFRRYFLFFKKTEDIREFEKLFICAYGENGFWPECKFSKIGSKMYEEGKRPTTNELPFPLTYEQALIIGVMLYKRDEEAFFICTGVGGSGKSTFGNIVKQLFENDVSYTAISELEGFKLAEAVKKRLIYSEEISSGELNCENLKMLASKQEIMVEAKFVTPYNVLTQSVMLFNCNKAPRVDVEDTGMLRRVIFYSRDSKIENPDLSIRRKQFTVEELSIIACYAYAVINNCPDWREIFRSDTFNVLMKNNRVYKYYSEKNIKNYEDYLEECSDDHVPDKFRKSEDNYYSLINFIEENIEKINEQLPF